MVENEYIGFMKTCDICGAESFEVKLRQVDYPGIRCQCCLFGHVETLYVCPRCKDVEPPIINVTFTGIKLRDISNKLMKTDKDEIEAMTYSSKEFIEKAHDAHRNVTIDEYETYMENQLKLFRESLRRKPSLAKKLQNWFKT